MLYNLEILLTLLFQQGRGYPDVPTRRSPHYCACIVFFILKNEHNENTVAVRPSVLEQVSAAHHWKVVPAYILFSGLWSIWLWHLDYISIWFNGEVSRGFVVILLTVYWNLFGACFIYILKANGIWCKISTYKQYTMDWSIYFWCG